MKYNISETDKFLAAKLKTQEGSQIKIILKNKILEEEKMLDFFEQSITHCNNQIQLCKIKSKQEISKRLDYETQKIVFEDNKLIWNISGFITLISMDIKTIQLGMYFAETEWHKRFYARQACTIMYESSNDIFDLLGKNFKELISKRIDITSHNDELKNIRARLNSFREANSDYLCTVRNNTAAHKDQDVLNQLSVISDINWVNIIELVEEFETIINDMGAFLKRLIDMGLANLKNSPIGQNKI